VLVTKPKDNMISPTGPCIVDSLCIRVTTSKAVKWSVMVLPSSVTYRQLLSADINTNCWFVGLNSTLVQDISIATKITHTPYWNDCCINRKDGNEN